MPDLLATLDVNALLDLLSGARTQAVLRAVLIMLTAWGLTRLIARPLRHALELRGMAHQAMLVPRVLGWAIFGLAATAALRELGFDLSVLLGAAGILTVAIGFASQTSASNLISGLFLLAERPFEVGDAISIGATKGFVLSVDLLSTRLRTFDNLLVRVPNETVLKSEVINLTRFPLRRCDFEFGVSYKEDIDAVEAVLLDIARRHPLCCDEPSPQVLFMGFGDSSLNLRFSVWATQSNYLGVRDKVGRQIKRRLEQAGMVIPYPHRSVGPIPGDPPLQIQIVPLTASDDSVQPTADRAPAAGPDARVSQEDAEDATARPQAG